MISGCLQAFLAVLEATWAILAALVAFLGRLGSFGEPQGGAMATEEPPKSKGAHATLHGEWGGPL